MKAFTTFSEHYCSYVCMSTWAFLGYLVGSSVSFDMSTVVKPLDYCSASWMFTLTITNSHDSAAACMQEPTVVMVVLHFRGFISINNAQWDYTWYTVVQFIHSSYITVMQDTGVQ